MGIPNPSDEVVQVRHADVAGDPTVITISCPDKTGLGCDLCRVVLLFGLNILKGDMSTDGRWCYIVLWVVASPGRRAITLRWDLLKDRLLHLCPVTAPFAFDAAAPPAPSRIYLLKFCCYDRLGLLHDVTRVLCELELTIRRVKVSTTPDGRVIDLFFITDARELLHTKSRREETYDKLQSVLGDSLTSCEIESATEEMSACLQASALLPQSVVEQMFNVDVVEEQSRSCGNLSVAMDNSLSPVHTLIQIQCGDHKGLVYDIMRTLKDCNIQISYGRFYASQNGNCEVDLFAVQSDGKKILEQHKQRALCSRLRMELHRPLRVALVDRGPDTELLVANPVEACGKGRPLVLYDITLALKKLHRRIFLAEIGRHVVADREWEVYRVHLGEGDHELSSSLRNKIVDGVTNMLMGWDSPPPS
ncbi:ACT domain-containing protein ACR10 [Oryza brachyantha]|uniref:ACT domain-containing protein ACR n=1 Tax=Oryza brachyantha TaxID=4533 RepID=J3N0C7_ORYBR|nr:ACT domain-containing protein ACR10 [Oryza brachyantha]